MKTKFFMLMTCSLFSILAHADGARTIHMDFEISAMNAKSIETVILGNTAILGNNEVECTTAAGLITCHAENIAIRATESGIKFNFKAQKGFLGVIKYSVEGSTWRSFKIDNNSTMTLSY